MSRGCEPPPPARDLSFRSLDSRRGPVDRPYSRHSAATAGLIAALAMLAASAQGTSAGETLAFRNVRVFDGAQVIPNATVLITDGTITRVGSNTEIPAGVRVIDGTGKTLLPGLMDCHAHTLDEAQLRQAAVFGVTTIFDMMCNPSFAARMRSAQAAGAAYDRADLRSAGTAAIPTGGAGRPAPDSLGTIDGPEQAQAFVDARIAEGSDYIKILCGDGEQLGLRGGPKLRRETIAAIIGAAHARKRLAVAHVLELEDARAVVA